MVKTASGAKAVQIVYSWPRGSREIEHLGSARPGVELELLKAAARQRWAAGRGVLDLGLDTAAAGGPLPVTASGMGCLADPLGHACRVLALTRPAAAMRSLNGLVLARITATLSGQEACFQQAPLGA